MKIQVKNLKEWKKKTGITGLESSDKRKLVVGTTIKELEERKQRIVKHLENAGQWLSEGEKRSAKKRIEAIEQVISYYSQ